MLATDKHEKSWLKLTKLIGIVKLLAVNVCSIGTSGCYQAKTWMGGDGTIAIGRVEGHGGQ